MMHFSKKLHFEVFAIEFKGGIQPRFVELKTKLSVELFDEICHDPKICGQSVVYWRA